MEAIQPEQTEQLLETAIAEARKWEGELGTGGVGKAEKAFEALKQGRFEIGNPQAYIQRLRQEDFESQQIVLAPDIKRSMQARDGYAFFKIPTPILMFPGRGAQYRLLEIQLTFEAAPKERQPAVQNVFPDAVWKPVLDWGAKLDLSLDANLQWGAKVDQTQAKIGKLGGKLSGRITNSDHLAGHLRVASFEYSLGRMDIDAQYSAQTAMWRLDSKQAIRSQKQMQAVTLLKVPREIRQIQIHAATQAEAAFDWLTAQVAHILPRLSQSLQDLFHRKRGLPLQDFQTWFLNLPE